MTVDRLTRQVVADSKEGSDIYGVVEKIAYTLYELNPNNSPEHNWFLAQDLFIEWADWMHMPCRPDFSDLESHLKGNLQYTAYSYRDSGKSSFDNWIKSQKVSAKRIIKQFYKPLREY